MINQDFIKILKVENSPRKIIHISFNNQDFIFKSLNRKEVLDIHKLNFDEFSTNDLICQTALIYPNSEEYNFSSCGFAGLPDFVSNIILNESTLNSSKQILEILEQKRNEIGTIDKQAFVFIKMAFPEVTKEQYEEMTWEEICEYVALSESIINTRETISIEKILDNSKEFKLSIDVGNEEDIEENISENQKTKEQLYEEHRKYVWDLYKKSIDPIFVYGEPKLKTKDIVEKPFLGSRLWYNEVVINEIRKAISKTTNSNR